MSRRAVATELLTSWYAQSARELPWRHPGVGPWAVLVSEVMLQQTPVSRVLPAYTQWLARWPTPAAQAASSSGDAVRAWGRLGYPRRALRLHAAAVALVADHGGEVPADLAALRALPGVGDYTAAAVASFAFGQRHAVLDTNVRRVIARAWSGVAGPAAAVTVGERRLAEALLPDDDQLAPAISVALMELGALNCHARAPSCDRCPLADRCAWRLADYPAPTTAPRRAQTYVGTDRQARGTVLSVLRAHAEPVGRPVLTATWADGVQLDRALAGLVADGLISPHVGNRFGLPT